MAGRPVILLAEALDAETEARLEAAAEVRRASRGDEASLLAEIGAAEALIARTHTPVTRRVLEAGHRLRVVGVAGVGVERVDETAAAELGIAVLSTPAAASDAVAEFTTALLLLLLRPIGRLSRAYAEGQFVEARRRPHGGELCELCVGIIGFGRIGSRVGRILSSGFGARVLYNDIAEVDTQGIGAERATLDEIWRGCDAISLHVPLTSVTRGLVGKAQFERMKGGALLVNTARGAVVDTTALVAALQSGQLGGAALDVVEPEPLPVGHPLFAMENCILTPHAAARTHGGLRRMLGVADAVLEFLGRGA